MKNLLWNHQNLLRFEWRRRVEGRQEGKQAGGWLLLLHKYYEEENIDEGRSEASREVWDDVLVSTGENSIMIRSESGKECHIFSCIPLPPHNNELFVVSTLSFSLSLSPILFSSLTFHGTSSIAITITNPWNQLIEDWRVVNGSFD